MNKICISLFICTAFFIKIAFAAQNIDDLVSQGKLTISVEIDKNKQHIVGQALVLSVEVATDRWFATGSRVQNFTLANVVMQANNINTINGSKRVQGKTWAMQTHEITLYPSLAGNYALPSFKVDVSVNTESEGIITGVLNTPESSFSIERPEELNGIDSFIVSRGVTLTVDGEFDPDKSYAIGEAITQTFTITASDTPAMMIPELNLFTINEASKKTAQSSPDERQQSSLDGISIYRKPAQIFDKSNRGSLLGTRIESFTYIFEKTGNYDLPEQKIYWWDSQSNTLEELVIPATSWTVSGGGLLKEQQVNNAISDIRLDLRTVIIITISCLLLALIYMVSRKRLLLLTYYKKITHYERRQLRKQFLDSITKHEYLMASQTLYHYALMENKQTEIKNLPLTNKLSQLSFQADSSRNIEVKFSVSDAKTLIKQIDILTYKLEKRVNFSITEVIELNHK